VTEFEPMLAVNPMELDGEPALLKVSVLSAENG
jgi:hypothetical protein